MTGVRSRLLAMARRSNSQARVSFPEQSVAPSRRYGDAGGTWRPRTRRKMSRTRLSILAWASWLRWSSRCTSWVRNLVKSEFCSPELGPMKAMPDPSRLPGDNTVTAVNATIGQSVRPNRWPPSSPGGEPEEFPVLRGLRLGRRRWRGGGRVTVRRRGGGRVTVRRRGGGRVAVRRRGWRGSGRMTVRRRSGRGRGRVGGGRRHRMRRRARDLHRSSAA
jgi:hypothetical protein